MAPRFQGQAFYENQKLVDQVEEIAKGEGRDYWAVSVGLDPCPIRVCKFLTLKLVALTVSTKCYDCRRSLSLGQLMLVESERMSLP